MKLNISCDKEDCCLKLEYCASCAGSEHEGKDPIVTFYPVGDPADDDKNAQMEKAKEYFERSYDDIPSDYEKFMELRNTNEAFHEFCVIHEEEIHACFGIKYGYIKD